MDHFAQARLKVEWAEKHIAELDTLVSEFFNDPNRYSLILEKNPKTRNSSYRVERLGEDVSPNTALIIGDALHNLRSSLDIAYHGFAIQVGGTITDWTRLLVEDSRETLLRRISSGTIEGLPFAQTFIVETIKPYKGGNGAIWSLHELNIADKHKLLIPIAQATTITGVYAEIGSITLEDSSFSIRDGRVVNAIGSDEDIHIQKYGKVTGQTFFQEGLPLAGEPIVPSLLRIAEETARAIDAFEFFTP
jgi:hypothetical protein